MCGHGEHDDASYIPAELKEAFADRDPLAVARRQVQAYGRLSEAEVAAVQAEAVDEVQRAMAQAQKEPTPVPAELMEEDPSVFPCDHNDIFVQAGFVETLYKHLP